MIIRTCKTTIALLLLIALTGCAVGPQDWLKTQALQPQDKNLDNVKDSLVFLVVNIKQPRARLKLRNFVATNLTTQKTYSFVFYDNFILGSSLLQHTVIGDTVEHMVFLDLPPATYSISSMEFFDFEWGIVTGNLTGNTSTYLDYTLFKPVNFEVNAYGVTDLGQLNIQIIQSTQTSTTSNAFTDLQSDYKLTNAYLHTMSGSIKRLKGILNFSTPGHRDIDLKKAKGRYPALRDKVFHKGKMWVEE